LVNRPGAAGGFAAAGATPQYGGAGGAGSGGSGGGGGAGGFSDQHADFIGGAGSAANNGVSPAAGAVPGGGGGATSDSFQTVASATGKVLIVLVAAR
jgi:hypothetical protein